MFNIKLNLKNVGISVLSKLNIKKRIFVEVATFRLLGKQIVKNSFHIKEELVYN